MSLLDEIVARHKGGEPIGAVSICSANPWVLRTALQSDAIPLLIESTCNQVNQSGGYLGLKPQEFVEYVKKMAVELNYPPGRIILGGDHLGPAPWQFESSESAMQKAEILVRDYVRAGYSKIHLDCSMRLADDAPGPLDPEISASRAARLANVAEAHNTDCLRYVIGAEVPLPGGAIDQERVVSVTQVTDLQRTIESTREAFIEQDLSGAWDRVIAIVVQPGVEYGDDFVLPYQSEKAKELSNFIEGYSFVYEAHSTDYQTRDALKSLVRDHFAILKVGPSLTFAFREAIFGLAMIEDEILPPGERSNIMRILDEAMIEDPRYWQKYYLGSDAEIALKRKYSLCDRARYYWMQPLVKQALDKMFSSLGSHSLPEELINTYLPDIGEELRKNNESGLVTPGQLIRIKIAKVLEDYFWACE